MGEPYPIRDHKCVPLCVLRTRGRGERKRGRHRRPLDGSIDSCNNASMIKSKQQPTLTEVLQAAIERSGLTVYRIGKATGVDTANLGRFVRGELSIDQA